MIQLTSKHMSDVRNILAQTREASDMDELRSRVVDLVHRAYESCSTIFWFTNSKNQMVQPVMKDIQEQGVQKKNVPANKYLTEGKTYFSESELREMASPLTDKIAEAIKALFYCIFNLDNLFNPRSGCWLSV